MLMTSTSVIISTSPTVEKEVPSRIRAALPKSMQIREETYLQFSAGITLDVIQIVIIFVSGGVAQGFFGELGKDAYQQLKRAVKDIFSKKKERALVIEFRTKETELSFRLETDDADVVDRALEKIPGVISEANESESASLYLGENGEWGKFEGKVAFVTEGVAATTDVIEKDGKRIGMTEQALREAAKQAVGLPMLVEHRGRPIGRITKSWMKDGKLFVRLVVFEPRNREEEAVVVRLKSGDLRGLSLGFSS